MTVVAMKDTFCDFARVAAPFLHISNASHYEETLALIELLLEEATDSDEDPLNAIIDLLSRAVESYENTNQDIKDFEQRVASQQPDIAALRVLMDQHGLGCSDLPEIGSKSMVSRVLSGELSLNKAHIKALAERFQLSPNVFF